MAIPMVDDFLEDSVKSITAPHAIIRIDKFKQQMSKKEYMVTVAVTNIGNDICRFVSMSLSSKDLNNIIDVHTEGVMRIARGGPGGNSVDVVAKDIAPLEYGSVRLTFEKEADVKYNIIKTDSKSLWRYSPVHEDGVDISVSVGPSINLKTGKPA